MDAGTTFVRGDHDAHLWVIVSDPKKDPENVLIVNFTSLDARKESVCILSRGDHPWIVKPTCVNYGDAIITSLHLLDEACRVGAISLREPVRPDVLARIREGAALSERMSLDKANVLIDQGLIEC
jgi:hypothetical protein